jgi:hypothetical protein
MVSDYCHCSDVDMSGYVPLDSRVVGACRCGDCSSRSNIKRWHSNDRLCRFDNGLCYDDGNCYSKRRISIGFLKGKPKFRVSVLKCKRCVDVLK